MGNAMADVIRQSVRRMIEFVMRSGDIDNSYRSTQRMLEGTKVHQRIQAAYGPNYQKEVVFKNTTLFRDVIYEVEGRADGLLVDGDEVMIDEIKSTTRRLEDLDPNENQLHWAQAKCYAYFYCVDHDRPLIDVQLTYSNVDDESVKKERKTFSQEALETFYLDLIERFHEFSQKLIAWRKRRDESIKDLEFPYPTYREGQRKMAVGVYQAIEEGKNLFVDAPTGIGKTMSAVYPAVMAMPAFDIEKIFYLTARTTTRAEAEKAIVRLAENGLEIKSCAITSKERICLNDEVKCNPVDCPYAKGHFDRVNDAILTLFDTENQLTRDVLERAAEEYTVCPFELQLDMSVYSDFVIGDYNYVFDPQVYLKRYFDENESPYVFLVDEAHNLVDRGRDMYSAQLSYTRFVDALAMFEEKSHRRIRREIRAGIDAFDALITKYATAPAVAVSENPESLYMAAKQIMQKLDGFLSKEKNHAHYDEILDFYFYLLDYCRIYETWQEGFVNTLENGEDGVLWTIRCLDTSHLFEAILYRARASIFFSATLTPIAFYTELLGGGKRTETMHLLSPFAEDNLLLLDACAVSTRYRDRSKSLEQVAALIHTFVNAKAGNYMVFFPSYAYMEQVQERYEAQYDDPLLVQDRSMRESERRAFLDKFDKDNAVTAFVVLGGIFAEGIDLIGERLIGACVVSVGMPGLSFERELIKRYFDEKEGQGFDYAFTYPGLNKVLQAVGRVIRTAADRGVALLIDDRFASAKYRRLYPAHWNQMRSIRDDRELDVALTEFWNVGEADEKEEATPAEKADILDSDIAQTENGESETK